MILINRKQLIKWYNRLKPFSIDYDTNIIITKGDPGNNVAFVGTLPLSYASKIFPNAGYKDYDFIFRDMKSNQLVHVYRRLQQNMSILNKQK